MKTPFLFFLAGLFLLCNAFSSPAQNKVSFGYDAAGNRISRTIVINPSSADPQEEEPFYSEMLSHIEVHIYPNPTEGRITIEIQHLEKDETADVALYTLSGNLLVRERNVSYSTEIDITSQPAGMYILRITAGEDHTEWKIIKK
ncbi:hypothetical protein AGMMS50262_19230 [Bacteroidia bacterium]|nr:hypothetical protein AGMMS50262_19230 [Bacteroidia bacterium]